MLSLVPRLWIGAVCGLGMRLDLLTWTLPEVHAWVATSIMLLIVSNLWAMLLVQKSMKCNIWKRMTKGSRQFLTRTLNNLKPSCRTRYCKCTIVVIGGERESPKAVSRR